MSQTPYSNLPLPAPGWYTDPISTNSQRYWDGQAWTTQTRPIAGVAPADVQSQQAGWQPRDEWGHGAQSVGYGPRPGPTTPDGVPLAGWWRRGGALIIDLVLVTIVTALFAAPFWSDLQMGMQLWLGEAMRAAEAGGTMPDYTDPRYGIMGPYWAIFAINRALDFFYSTGLQMSRGGTLGMLALGLRVVPVDKGREHHGLPMSTAIVRNLAYLVVNLISLATIINFIAAAFTPKRQTLHDMVARTQVVRIR